MKMKAITKRIIAVIIAVLMLASLIPATSVFAVKDEFKKYIISSAEVSGLTAPKIGADVDTSGTVPSGSNYSIVKVNWFDASGVLAKATSFEAGKPYRVSVEVKPNKGYSFDKNAAYTINGKTATETSANSDRTEITFILDYAALKKTENATSSKKPAATSSKVTEESSEIVEETSSEEEIVSETESTTPSSTVSVYEKTNNNLLDVNLVILIIAIVALLCITAVVVTIIIKKKK